jgi:hypothetical protein
MMNKGIPENQGGINISFGDNLSSVKDVTIPVEVIDPEEGQVARAELSLDKGGSIVGLAPGRYLVRAPLPSGELLSDNVTILEGQVDLQLHSRNLSPTNDLDVSYAIQSIPSSYVSTYVTDQDRIELGSIIDKSPKNRVSDYFSDALNQKSMGLKSTPRAEEMEEMLSVFLNTNPISISKKQESNLRAVVLNPPPAPVISDGTVQIKSDGKLWRIQKGKDLQMEPLPPELIATDRRLLGGYKITADQTDSLFWKIYTVQEHSYLVVIPPQARQLLLVSESLDENSSVHPRLEGGSTQAEALLSYLSQGAFDMATTSSQAFLKSANNLLAAKMSDPSAASVAALFFVKTGQLERLQWMANLANVFPWLPDGAILYAWALLHLPQPSLDEVAKWLFVGANRGVPMLTQVVSLLNDGLVYLEGHRKYLNPETATQLSDELYRAQILAQTIDPTSNYTSLDWCKSLRGILIPEQSLVISKTD